MTIQITLAALLSGLCLIVEHYLPWEDILGRPLRVLDRYVMGVATMALAISGLFLAWKDWNELIAVWVVVIMSGLAVIGAYALDKDLDTRKRLKAAEKAERILRDGTIDE